MENQQKSGLHTGLGITSLIIGIIGLLISFLPCLGQFSSFIAPIGILLGIGGYYSARQSKQSTGLNLGAIITGLIAFCIAWSQAAAIHGAVNSMHESLFGTEISSINYPYIGFIVIVLVVMIIIHYQTGNKETLKVTETIENDIVANNPLPEHNQNIVKTPSANVYQPRVVAEKEIKYISPTPLQTNIKAQKTFDVPQFSENQNINSSVVPEQTNISQSPRPVPRMIAITGIVLILLVTGLLTYFFYLKPKWKDDAAPRYYIYADDVALRSSPIQGVSDNILSTLRFGSELITYDNGAEWSHIKINDKEGYVSSKYMLDSLNFYLLNSIFGDVESRQQIESAKCRKALLVYFTNHNYIGKMDGGLQARLYNNAQQPHEIWQVFSKQKGEKTNTSIYPYKLVNPDAKFTDFGVIIKNISNDTRKFLLFTFNNDDETASLIDEQTAPISGDIKEVKKTFADGRPVYNVVYTSF